MGTVQGVTAVFNLSGGTLNVTGQEGVGGGGDGTFNQTGGDHLVSAELTVGTLAASGHGIFNYPAGTSRPPRSKIGGSSITPAAPLTPACLITSRPSR